MTYDHLFPIALCVIAFVCIVLTWKHRGGIHCVVWAGVFSMLIVAIAGCRSGGNCAGGVCRKPVVNEQCGNMDLRQGGRWRSEQR
jgi:hypothetical protein